MPRTKKEVRAANKREAYSWISYMVTHAPEEMARVRKYGTPSDELISLAERKVFMRDAQNRLKKRCFPESLHKSSGQKMLLDILLKVDLHINSIPTKAFELYEHVQSAVVHRRADTQTNLRIVAEAILHRAACEKKTQVIFSYDSMNTWIKAAYGKILGYATLHRALEMLEEQKIIKVDEWGVKNNRHRATKIRILPISEKTEVKFSPEMDEWLLYKDHAMTAVYARESVSRQDVVEEEIHRYFDHLVMEDEITDDATYWLQEFGPGVLFRNRADAKMTEVSVEAVEVMEGLWTDDYIDRLLGNVVQPMQSNGSVPGRISNRIRGQNDFAETRSG